MPKDGDECRPAEEVKVEVTAPAVEVKAPKVEVEVKPKEIKVEEKVVVPEIQQVRDPNKQYIGSGKDRLSINIDEPEWDVDSVSGRMKNYMAPRRLRYFFAGSDRLKEAKELLRKYL